MKLLQKLGSIQVVSKDGNSRMRGQGLFLCPCCKEEVIRPLDNGARTTSCGRKGCRESTKPAHGYTGKRLYTIWNNIRLRCDNPNSKSYFYYGARGITYPESWKTFEGFFLDMGMTYVDGLTIDRIDPTKGYSKENCQWITHAENVSKDKKKEVAKYTLDGEYITRYPSVQAAVAAEGYKFNASISKVARGERSQYRGFNWNYV